MWKVCLQLRRLLKSYGCKGFRRHLRACEILLQDTFNRFLGDVMKGKLIAAVAHKQLRGGLWL